MNESPTPDKGQHKRRGLQLPPRGQALARLQDLEEGAAPDVTEAEARDAATPLTEGSNAVNTARSNAVNHQGSNTASDNTASDNTASDSTALTPAVGPTNEVASGSTVQIMPAPVPPITSSGAAAVGSGHQVSARAVREPTTRITVDMPDSLHRKISMLSAETRRSIKELVIEALSATYFGTDAGP